MDLQNIDAEFLKILTAATGRGSEAAAIRKKIGITPAHARQYRYRLDAGSPISLEKKIHWLQLAGIPTEVEKQFTKADLVDLINFYNSKRVSSAAKQMGAEYIVEKFIALDGKYTKRYDKAE